MVLADILVVGKEFGFKRMLPQGPIKRYYRRECGLVGPRAGSLRSARSLKQLLARIDLVLVALNHSPKLDESHRVSRSDFAYRSATVRKKGRSRSFASGERSGNR